MMDKDWQLQLLKEIQTNTKTDSKDTQPDLMLQPITTQQNFNLNNSFSPTPQQIKNHNAKEIKQTNQKDKINKPKKDSQSLNKQSRRFRQYLSEKVQQLRKSKQIINSPQKKENDSIKKPSILRSIINQQEQKQKISQIQKIQSIKQKPQQTNKLNKTNIKEYEKKLSNSSSHFERATRHNSQQKNINQFNSIKKSLDFSANKKPSQMPHSTPSSKPPFPKRTQHDPQNGLIKKKLTIDAIDSRKNLNQIKERKNTPESKNSFRIKRTSNVNTSNQASIELRNINQLSNKSIEMNQSIHQSKNKKMREEFMKLNQQQKRIQMQIFKAHQQTKNFLNSIMNKYQLSHSAFQKYGIKKEYQDFLQSKTTSPSKKQIKDKKDQKTSQTQIKQSNQVNGESSLNKQKMKNSFLDDEIEKINRLLKSKEKQIDKFQNKIDRNPFMQFLKQLPEDILQEFQEEEENQIVQQLPINNQNMNDGKQFSSTYSSVMSQIKSKKWGLKQRITFETHRQSIEKKNEQKQSRNMQNFSLSQQKIPQKSQNTNDQYVQYDENENKNNRIQVNSRLKSLLFE